MIGAVHWSRDSETARNPLFQTDRLQSKKETEFGIRNKIFRELTFIHTKPFYLKQWKSSKHPTITPSA